MTRDDQFFALYLLIANLWFVGANIATHHAQRIICATCGTIWIIALTVQVTT